MRILFSTLIFLVCISNNSQENYYVSSSIGDNTNPGTSESSPFLTIARALNNIQPGGTIYVMDGLYNNEGFGSADPQAENKWWSWESVRWCGASPE